MNKLIKIFSLCCFLCLFFTEISYTDVLIEKTLPDHNICDCPVEKKLEEHIEVYKKQIQSIQSNIEYLEFVFEGKQIIDGSYVRQIIDMSKKLKEMESRLKILENKE